jgi:hypothetical protein
MAAVVIRNQAAVARSSRPVGIVKAATNDIFPAAHPATSGVSVHDDLENGAEI